MLQWLVTLGMLASCGRIGFEATAAVSGDDDAQIVDDTSDRPNVVFLSAGAQPGGFGGIANADMTCATEAATAGLPGTFVAFLSDPTTHARDRLAGSRGWTLPDGTPVGDTIASMIDSDRVLNPINMEASGTHVATGSTWTGSTLAGVFDPTRSCSNWTDSTDASTGQGQSIRSALIAGGNAPGCSSDRRFLCFEIGHAHDVTVTPTSGRFVFTTLVKSAAVDVPTADARCNSDAANAGLPGTYLAALNTSTVSTASRFTIDARAWVRIDGTQVSAATEMFTGAVTLTSFVSQVADGTYLNTTFWTGVATSPESTATTNETCIDWTSNTNANTAIAGQSHQTAPSAFWSGTPGRPCDTLYSIMCMQE